MFYFLKVYDLPAVMQDFVTIKHPAIVFLVAHGHPGLDPEHISPQREELSDDLQYMIAHVLSHMSFKLFIQGL